jgi:hypothetical protein
MSEPSQATQPTWLVRNERRIAAASIAIAVLGVIIEIFAGFGYRMELIPFQAALLQMLPVGAYIAAAGAVLCAVAVVLSYRIHKGAFLRPAAPVFIALIVAGLAVYFP